MLLIKVKLLVLLSLVLKNIDVVNHEILLKRLKAYKFDQTPLNWMCSYLSNRKQCIVENELRSSVQPIKAGVPQGPILGPVLFLLFVNDLPVFVNETYLVMYADDTNSTTQIRTKTYCNQNFKTVQLHLTTGVFQTVCS